MADTFTTNLNLTKPEPGAAEDTWGISLNADLDALDAIFSSNGTSVALNLDGAVIDSSVIGGTTAAAGSFTTLSASTSITGTLATAAQPNITSLGTLSALTVTGEITANGGIALGNNDKATFGAGDALEIYSNGSKSIIKESGAESLVFQATNINFKDATDTDFTARFITGGDVRLYHDGNQKLATTSTGIDVTGTVTADLLTVNTSSPSGTVALLKGSSGFGFTFSSDATSPYVQSIGVGGGEEVAITSGGTKLALFQDGGDISFYDDTGTSQALYWDASTERLGIGTTSPSANLHVSSSGDTIARITSADGNGAFLDLGDASDPDGGRIVYDSGSNLGFSTASTERMRIDSSGRVGIGTTSPSEELTIRASVPKIQIEDSDGTNQYGQFYHSAGITSILARNNTSDGTIVFQKYDGTTTDETMRIDSSGNVGIGTTSPAEKLQVDGNIRLGPAHTTRVGTDGTNAYFENFANGAVIFRNNGYTERMRINSSGNVGVGTSSPDRKLHINESASATSNFIHMTTAATGASGSNGFLVGIGSAGNAELWNYEAQPIIFATSSSERMRIDSSGNVGIGTSSPSTFGVLAVKKDQTADTAISVSNAGSSSASTTMSFTLNESGTTQGWLRRYRDGTGNTEVGFSDALLFSGNVTGSKTERMRIDASGNVGIGITSPSKPLHIYSASDTAIRLQNSTTGTGTTDGLLIEQSGLDSLIVNYEAGNLRFHTSNSEAMRIDSSGNVGIGTSSPAAKLSIDGGTAGNYTDGISLQKSGGNVYGIYPSTNNLEFRSVTGGNHIATFDYFGNVGIGNSSPARNLSINATSPHLQLCNSTTGTTAGNGFELAVAGNTAYIMQREDANMIIGTNDTERMRIDSSGNLLVGTTDTSLYNNGAGGNTGVVVEPSGTIQLAKSNNICAYLNRLDSDGTILDLRKDGTVVGSIGCEGIKLKINSVGDGVLQSNGSDRYVWDTSQFYPSDDNLRDLGFSSFRWDDIYATNGTIQTSDRNEKQDIEALTDAETRVAVAAKKLLRKFRWKDAVAEKGDEARTHFGIIAQDLQDAFTAEGLDAGDYAMFISSTWTNDDGVEQTRLGVRYNELLAFIIAAI